MEIMGNYRKLGTIAQHRELGTIAQHCCIMNMVTIGMDPHTFRWATMIAVVHRLPEHNL